MYSIRTLRYSFYGGSDDYIILKYVQVDKTSMHLMKLYFYAVENNLDRIKIINTGVKAFTRCENKVHFFTFKSFFYVYKTKLQYKNS
jgi:hypothetical protein